MPEYIDREAAMKALDEIPAYENGDTHQDGIDSAKKAISNIPATTRRPPNKPLTKEQIMAKDDYETVWVVNRNGAVMDSEAGAIKTILRVYERSIYENGVYFSAKPTAADIEAAKMERVQ